MTAEHLPLSDTSPSEPLVNGKKVLQSAKLFCMYLIACAKLSTMSIQALCNNELDVNYTEVTVSCLQDDETDLHVAAQALDDMRFSNGICILKDIEKQP
jgi:hypothetical protein